MHILQYIIKQGLIGKDRVYIIRQASNRARRSSAIEGMFDNGAGYKLGDGELITLGFL